MRLRVVGCSGSVPGPASPASCYLVEAEDGGRTWRLVLDLGSGALGPLQRWCDPREIDAIALSHLHPDHCADLAALRVYLARHPDGPVDPVPVYAPFGTPSRLEQIRGKPGAVPEFAIHALQAGTPFFVGPMRVTPESVEHTMPAYAFRVEGPPEGGRHGDVGVGVGPGAPDPGAAEAGATASAGASAAAVLAYSGDADECDGLEAAAAGADVFLCEATFLDAPGLPTGIHLTARGAGEIAERVGTRALVLTHVPPWTDPNAALTEAEAEYSGPLSLARPGLEIAI